MGVHWAGEPQRMVTAKRRWERLWRLRALMDEMIREVSYRPSAEETTVGDPHE
jgi:hypothetical protein